MKPRMLLAVLLLISGCRQASKLEGTYYEWNESGRGETHYSFRTGGTFTYRSDTANGMYGAGTYTVRFGRLKLKYGKVNLTQPYGGSVTVTSVPYTADSKRLEVMVLDESGLPFPYCIVVLHRTDSSSLSWGGSPDMNGKITFAALDPALDSVIIDIRVSGYCRIYQKIKLSTRTHAQCKMEVDKDAELYAVDSGRVEKYRIRNIRRDSFQLQNSYWGSVRDERGSVAGRRRYTDVKKLVRDTI